ncbi:hypothetical protein EYM_05535 [Ignicoccus islandicus DSM 13165]|uniref:Cytochrome b561 bacterial/Ni-hydrogenase domain-containing protein n=1 Tax=Ignicoccus islandicus DSM 13165 TaxID=940295 RepID=A0A0U2WNR2_9CREN|nr:cytochrome b/b6 domain-containing protein [Ignicoccus islandicus]ALU12593.1 hypothetical protein EYM_05535 [Ignicoccus islandicus DSM 13165]
MGSPSHDFEEGRIGYLIGSLIGTAIAVGIAWGFVYEYALKVLLSEWPVRGAVLGSFDVGNVAWWRSLISVAFDLLILVIAIVGTLWVLVNFLKEVRMAGKWRLYYEIEEAKRDVWIPRLSKWQRIQHLWMIITFTVCAVTGFAANAGIGDKVALIVTHVYSGIAMGILAILHFTYYTTQALILKARGENLKERFPILEFYSVKFLKNVVSVLMGKKPEPYGKYDPEQLFEYWGIYWGMLVLGIPGFIILLWGPHVLGGILWTMHVKEAVLAVTFILMVHIAYTHFRPSIFPLDLTFLTGRMPRKRALEEHPRWLREISEEA